MDKMHLEINSFNAIKRYFMETYGFFRDSAIKQIEIQRGTYSNVARVQVEINGGNNRYFYIKQLRGNTDNNIELKRNIFREYEATQKIYNVFYKQKYFSAIKPIVCYPEFHVIIMEEKQGTRLDIILNQNAKYLFNKISVNELQEYSYLCGKWLNLFQRQTIKQLGGKLEIEKLIHVITKRLKQLVEIKKCPLNYNLNERIMEYVKKNCQYINDNDLTLVNKHGDFGTWNVLINNKKVTIMDFEDFKDGSVYEDLAVFYQGLEIFKEKPHIKNSIIEKMQMSFLKGYLEDESYTKIKKRVFLIFILKDTLDYLYTLVSLENLSLLKAIYIKRHIAIRMKWIDSIVCDREYLKYSFS